MKKTLFNIGAFIGIVVSIGGFIAIFGLGFKHYQEQTPEERVVDEKSNCETFSKLMNVTQLPAYCLKYINLPTTTTPTTGNK